uniref:DNA-directed RNA polymerase n=1 Tax=Aphanochaete confervicola TaxID=764104 RepID=A0A6H1XE43_9CHLO|nr:beta subunit of RNA polymerase [Aphanochaete confervicola]QJA13879.1 beta subunit of RNA polymerase [Aphanochaete confervicola]
MTIEKYFIPDFVELQTKSYQRLLKKGLIEELNKRNPITNIEKTVELLLYPEYYKLCPPRWNSKDAILQSKTYSCRLYVPAQLTDRRTKRIQFKWVLLGDIPLMSKRGHFIVNGAARVIINQIVRGPGIYFSEIQHNINDSKNANKNVIRRYAAEFISMRGTWLRFSVDKKKTMWAELKKTPKIPLLWFLLAMGLNEKTLFQSLTRPTRLLNNYLNSTQFLAKSEKQLKVNSVKLNEEVIKNGELEINRDSPVYFNNLFSGSKTKFLDNGEKEEILPYINSSTTALELTFANITNNKKQNKDSKLLAKQGRKWLFKKFMNPRTYDLGMHGRLSLNKKLGLSLPLSQRTLTMYDVLLATEQLIRLEQGLLGIDDIDHLKNRRVRTSSDLIQMQIGVGLLRLEKSIREKFQNLPNEVRKNVNLSKTELLKIPKINLLSPHKDLTINSQILVQLFPNRVNTKNKLITQNGNTKKTKWASRKKQYFFPKIQYFFSTKPLNGALREFFGTNPLSQFMDQINPLAEVTHKRRLTSLGPGGVSRDTATMAIRGIHSTHYGRICPVETPEGKNAGLVSSLTSFARVNPEGLIQTPFYKVYKGQVQKNAGFFYLTAEQEEKSIIAAGDLNLYKTGFLQKGFIPVRKFDEFTKFSRNHLNFICVSPIQMISIATSLVPFLEHDDANRALMGANMQRQAVPLLRSEQPIVGTGMEARTVSDSGHVIRAKTGGFVTYVSGKKIRVCTFMTSQ